MPKQTIRFANVWRSTPMASGYDANIRSVATRRRFALVWLALFFTCVSARAADRVDPNTLTGKLIMGYQGWFDCPGDGTKLGWGHWMAGSDPAIDMLPDMSEFAAAERCPSSMKTAEGHSVDLFTDQDLATVEKHFDWMEQYGLDGIALERFAVALLMPEVLKGRDRVLENVRRAAEDHGRVFFVMYDLSGLKSANLPAVVQDWDRLQREGLTRSSAYQRHRGHPVLAIWGLGFSGRDLSPEQAETLLDGLLRVSEPYGGVTFLGGLPTYWRTRDHDASPNPGWERVWRRLGVLSPWSVGRFTDDAGADAYHRAVVKPDMAAARELGVDYMPVVFPGYSRANGARVSRPPGKATFNATPRRCGRFYWRQVSDALGAGASMLFGAMFDEVNEGTAMFKILAETAQEPVLGIPPQTSFVALDADGCRLPSDWYLRLAGAATKALHGGARPSPELPLQLPPN
jgi:hypothetical protein